MEYANRIRIWYIPRQREFLYTKMNQQQRTLQNECKLCASCSWVFKCFFLLKIRADRLAPKIFRSYALGFFFKIYLKWKVHKDLKYLSDEVSQDPITSPHQNIPIYYDDITSSKLAKIKIDPFHDFWQKYNICKKQFVP